LNRLHRINLQRKTWKETPQGWKKQLPGFTTALYPQFSSSSLQETTITKPLLSAQGKLSTKCLGRHCRKTLTHHNENALENAKEM